MKHDKETGGGRSFLDALPRVGSPEEIAFEQWSDGNARVDVWDNSCLGWVGVNEGPLALRMSIEGPSRLTKRKHCVLCGVMIEIARGFMPHDTLHFKARPCCLVLRLRISDFFISAWNTRDQAAAGYSLVQSAARTWFTLSVSANKVYLFVIFTQVSDFQLPAQQEAHADYSSVTLNKKIHHIRNTNYNEFIGLTRGP